MSRGPGRSTRGTLTRVVTGARVVLAALAAVVGAGLVLRAVLGSADLRGVEAGLGMLLLLVAVSAASAELGERRAASDLRRRTAAVATRVDEVREKQSRHEYRQEAALARVEQAVQAVRADVEGHSWALYGGQARTLTFTPSDEGRTRVLLVTSNGGGLGHLTRCLAVADHNRDRISAAVVTLSTAHDAVAGMGYDVEHVPSPATTGEPWPRWHRRFSRHLQALVRANEVDVVVFDGTWVYRGLTEVCDRLDVPLVWLCRGTWRADADRTQLASPLQHCDHVLVPEDVSGDLPELDVAAPWVTVCPPITVVDRSGALPADEARERLGLDPAGRYALVQVGGGNVGDVSTVAATAASALREHGFTPVVVASPMSSHGGVPTELATVISGVYPLARYLDAFELAVCAGGYNSVHENLALGLPAVYVPSTATTTDDQVARVEEVERLGLGIVARTGDDVATAVATLARHGVLDAMRRRLADREPVNGARAAGDAVLAVAGSGVRRGRPA
ncbi:glycosyltransferase [Actinotalea sp. AC32]|nr:glycosyltransferase [Actinotalea sp. AC32]